MLNLDPRKFIIDKRRKSIIKNEDISDSPVKAALEITKNKI